MLITLLSLEAVAAVRCLSAAELRSIFSFKTKNLKFQRQLNFLPMHLEVAPRDVESLSSGLKAPQKPFGLIKFKAWDLSAQIFEQLAKSKSQC